jgi:hypothetical protein
MATVSLVNTDDLFDISPDVDDIDIEENTYPYQEHHYHPLLEFRSLHYTDIQRESLDSFNINHHHHNVREFCMNLLNHPSPTRITMFINRLIDYEQTHLLETLLETERTYEIYLDELKRMFEERVQSDLEHPEEIINHQHYSYFVKCRNEINIKLQKLKQFLYRIREDTSDSSSSSSSGLSSSHILNVTPWKSDNTLFETRPMTLLEKYYEMTKIRPRQQFFRSMRELTEQFEGRYLHLEREQSSDRRSYYRYQRILKQIQMIERLLCSCKPKYSPHQSFLLHHSSEGQRATHEDFIVSKEPFRCIQGFGKTTTYPIEGVFLTYLTGWFLLAEVSSPISKFLHELFRPSYQTMMNEIFYQVDIQSLSPERITGEEDCDCIQLIPFKEGDEVVVLKCEHRLLKTSFMSMCKPLIEGIERDMDHSSGSSPISRIGPIRFKCPLCRDITLFTLGHLD